MRRAITETPVDLWPPREIHSDPPSARTNGGAGGRETSAIRTDVSALPLRGSMGVAGMPVPEDFLNSKDFLSLSRSERTRLCQREAFRAKNFAEHCEPKCRETYLDIANQWLALAYDIENAPSSR